MVSASLAPAACAPRIVSAPRALAVDPHRKTGDLAQARDQLPRAMWLQRAGRVVQEHTRGAEIRQLRGLFHQRIGLAGSPRAVDEARLELTARTRDGVRSLP